MPLRLPKKKTKMSKVEAAAKAFDELGIVFDSCVERQCPPIQLPPGFKIKDQKTARCSAIRCVKESAALARSDAAYKRAVAKQTAKGVKTR